MGNMSFAGRGAAEKPRLFLHPYCLSSLELLDSLADRYGGELTVVVDTVFLVNSSRHSIVADAVPSVPALEADGVLVGIDPLEPGYVEGFIEGDRGLVEKYLPRGGGEAFERVKNSLLSSSYMLLAAQLGPRDLSYLLDTRFYRAAARIDAGAGDYREHILNRLGELEQLIWGLGIRITAYNYLREAYMAYGENAAEKALDDSTIMLWLHAKNSMGRTRMAPGNPWRSRGYSRVAALVKTVLEERIERYLDKIMIEEEKVAVLHRRLREKGVKVPA